MLQDAARHAEAVGDHGIDTGNAKALAKMGDALLSLKKVAEKARKLVVEPALDDEMDDGSVGMSAVDPEMMLSVVNNPNLDVIATEVKTRLQHVLEELPTA